MSTFKLTYVPDCRIPQTYEGLARLDYPSRIKACRALLRVLVTDLVDRGGMDLHDTAQLFGGVPEWISSQKHAWGRLQVKERWWRCNECGKIDKVEKFFGVGTIAICPQCKKTNAVEISSDGPPAEEKKLGPVPGLSVSEEEYNKAYDAAMEDVRQRSGKGRLTPNQRKSAVDAAKAFLKAEDEVVIRSRGPGRALDRQPVEAPRCCDGHTCPVCSTLQNTESVIEDHYCKECGTRYCPTCHGIVETRVGMTQATSCCGRCKCDVPLR